MPHEISSETLAHLEKLCDMVIAGETADELLAYVEAVDRTDGLRGRGPRAGLPIFAIDPKCLHLVD